MFFIKKLTQPMDMNAPPKPQSTPEIRKKLIYKAAEEELAAKEKAEKESAASKGKEE